MRHIPFAPTLLRLLPWLLPVGLLLGMGTLSAVWYDDACHYLVVHTLATVGLEAFPVWPTGGVWDRLSLFITVGPAANYPTAGLMQLLGPYMWVARLSAGLFAGAALLGLWHLGRHHFRHTHTGIWAVLLLGLNVQFATYGSQYLGEPFLLGWLLLGISSMALWLKRPALHWLLLAMLGCNGAILSKEYVALPLGLSLLTVLAVLLWHRDPRARGWLWLCATLPLGAVLYYLLRFDSLETLQAYWSLKRNYSEEFWVFQWRTALGFVALKPVIWLGMLALAVRVYVRRRLLDGWLLALQGWLMLGYVASAAFDRFGLLLMPIPALYLAEWFAAIWARGVQQPYARYPVATALGLLASLAVLAMQRTPLMLWHHWQQRQAPTVPCLAQSLQPHHAYFTYDLQLVPHLMDRPWRLPTYPPSSWTHEPPLHLRPNELLLAGDYAHTEYMLDSTQWVPLRRCGVYSLRVPASAE